MALLFYPDHRCREASVVHFDTQLLVAGFPELWRREWLQDCTVTRASKTLLGRRPVRWAHLSFLGQVILNEGGRE